ncbi:MAG: PQQ-binding-like beta-propeller repeat protein [bacterium]|nr:PQQ-binding-like beta-propeller repeat protein [bacterium]
MKQRTAFTVLSACLLILSAIPLLQAQLDASSPWPMFQAGVRHTAQSSHIGSVTGRLHWSYAFEGDYLESQPSIGSDGRVYIGTYDENITALSPEGALLWSYKTGSNLDSVPAINSDGMLYVGSQDRHLYAFTSAGVLSWSYTTGLSVRSSPAIGADGRVYFTSTEGNLYRITPQGVLLWSYDILNTGLGVFSSPALGVNEMVYAGSDDNALYAVNSNGVFAWSYVTAHWIRSSPAVGSAGQVYVGSYDGMLYELTSSGALSWSYHASPRWYSPAVGSDGRLYVNSALNLLYAFSPNRTLLWSYEVSNDVTGTAIDAEGRVYFSSYDNTLRTLLSDSSSLWSYTMGNYNYVGPVIAHDGTVYQASADNVLYCFRDPTPTPTATPTPPIDLTADKAEYGQADRISVTADVWPILTPCHPFVRIIMADGRTLYYERGRGFVISPTPYLGFKGGPITVLQPILGYPVLEAGFSGITPGPYFLEGGAVDMTRTTSASNLVYYGTVDREELTVQQ